MTRAPSGIDCINFYSRIAWIMNWSTCEVRIRPRRVSRLETRRKASSCQRQTAPEARRRRIGDWSRRRARATNRRSSARTTWSKKSKWWTYRDAGSRAETKDDKPGQGPVIRVIGERASISAADERDFAREAVSERYVAIWRVPRPGRCACSDLYVQQCRSWRVFTQVSIRPYCTRVCVSDIYIIVCPSCPLDRPRSRKTETRLT